MKVLLLISICTLCSLATAQVNAPDWARRAIWYQIFPERFRNGDPTNDPKAADIVGSWPHRSVKGWKPSDWTSDWYQPADWEKASGLPFYTTVQLRRYGGDLQGVLDRLDYLQTLGITAIYLNPLFESPSLHKYDASSYHHIDNNFGPNPDGDRRIWAAEDPSRPETWRWTSADSMFLRVVRECHARGMKVIIDGVFNHVGMTFWAFQDVRSNGERSAFKDWFMIRAFDDPATLADEFSYVGWAGVAELPELREDSNGLLAPIRQHVHAVVRRWMDPNGDGDPSDGIDGWRLDVAEKVEISFWRDFRRWVREVNPDAYLVGEVFWEDWSNDKMFNAAPWLQGDVFDAVMNYRWARLSVEFFAGRTTTMPPTEFVRRLEALLADYPALANEVMLNLYDSHDTERIASRVVNPDLPYDKRVSLNDNPSFEIRKPIESEWDVVKLLTLFQMTYRGAPSIFAGSESGMWGGDDPDCRKPTLWDDLSYSVERSHPFGGTRPADSNVVRRDLRAFVTDCAMYRRAHPALSEGSLQFTLANDQHGLLGYVRETKDDRVYVVLNNAKERRHVTVDLPADRGEWKPGLNAENVVLKDGRVTATLGGKSGFTLHQMLR